MQNYFSQIKRDLMHWDQIHHPADIYRHKSKTFQKNRRKQMKRNRRRKR